jgi:drug/metabolite transporter (DMT)-like permease
VEAGLMTLIQPVAASALVWLVLGERPSDAALLGGLIVLAALAAHAGGQWRALPRPAG